MAETKDKSLEANKKFIGIGAGLGFSATIVAAVILWNIQTNFFATSDKQALAFKDMEIKVIEKFNDIEKLIDKKNDALLLQISEKYATKEYVDRKTLYLENRDAANGVAIPPGQTLVDMYRYQGTATFVPHALEKKQ